MLVSSKVKFTSFSNNLHDVCSIQKKSLIKRRQNQKNLRNLEPPLQRQVEASFKILQSSLYPPKTFLRHFVTRNIPSLTMKWKFSQFSTRVSSSHLYNTILRYKKQSSKVSPNTQKSCINNSKVSSTIYVNMDIIHH